MLGLQVRIPSFDIFGCGCNNQLKNIITIYTSLSKKDMIPLNYDSNFEFLFQSNMTS